MRFRDAEPSVAIDVSPFVTYMEPEFLVDDDDGSDLPLPDLAELAPNPQESSGRRKRTGRPLRDTVDELSAAVELESDDDFGEGILADTPADISNRDQSQIDSNPETEADATPRKKPRRRRRRRNRVRSDHSAEGSVTDAHGLPAPETQTARSPAVAGDGATEEESTGTGRKRRRRRRRGRRSGGKRDGTDTATQQGPSPAPGSAE